MKTFFVMLAILAFAPDLQADNWPNWRGPNSNGVAQGKSFPTSWSTDKNIHWRVELPAFGSSTPAVWGDKVFITSPKKGSNVVLCLNLEGKMLWESEVGKTINGKHKMGSGSNPSPVTDGKHVFVYYKSGDFGCLDFDGKLVWKTNLQSKFGDDTLWWDLGTSPVLTKDYVVVACMQEGPSYVAAFGKTDGQLVWKQDRMTGAPRESDQSYTTPIVTTRDGKEEIIVLGADYVTTHDAATGKEIWRVGGLNPKNSQMWRSIASPVFYDGTVYAPYARGKTLTAIKVGGKGDQTKENTLWTKKGVSIDVPTPTVKDGKIYICNDQGAVECIDRKTGETLWKVETKGGRRGKFYSSPIIGGKNLYTTREDGTTFVVDIESKQVIAQNKLGGKTAASAVLVNGRILMRASDAIYCIGE
ncbi:MAG: PQQ-binding-like beta-propeller repeat protein [Pirellulaceae bacterium]|nr:PQQ-binding-like beta-propeller repeat protein [Pirellulaceae bacterium]